MKILKKLTEKIRRRALAAKERDIRASFQVRAANGALWLTVNGVAFKRIEGNTPSVDVIKLLDSARDVAVIYATV